MNHNVRKKVLVGFTGDMHVLRKNAYIQKCIGYPMCFLYLLTCKLVLLILHSRLVGLPSLCLLEFVADVICCPISLKEALHVTSCVNFLMVASRISNSWLPYSTGDR
jgi:hypothetical protein